MQLSNDRLTLMRVRNGDLNEDGSFNIPDSVTHIGGSAFYRCRSLTSVIIPNSVTYIGDDAFFRCRSLTSVIIPNSVTHISNNAFYDCKNLTSAIIPNSVTHIGDGAFAGCTSLISIIIQNSGTHIGDGAFAGCTSLTSVIIPNSVTHIGDNAFRSCTSLTSVIIPNSVTDIGNWAFNDCTTLTSVIIPNSVTRIGNFAFFGCTSLTNVIIPNSVTHMGDGAFADCTSLTSVIMPNSVTHIGICAFSGCTNLNRIIVDSNDNEEIEGIKSLLPATLQGKVIKKSLHDDFVSLKADALNKLAITPQFSKIYKENAYLPQGLPTEILGLINAYLKNDPSDLHPMYEKAQKEIELVQVPINEEGTEAFKQALSEVVKKYRALAEKHIKPSIKEQINIAADGHDLEKLKQLLKNNPEHLNLLPASFKAKHKETLNQIPGVTLFAASKDDASHSKQDVPTQEPPLKKLKKALQVS